MCCCAVVFIRDLMPIQLSFVSDAICIIQLRYKKCHFLLHQQLKMLSDIIFCCRISKQILSLQQKPSNGGLLKGIKVITAFSVRCFLDVAFKQSFCISIIARKRAWVCFFSHQCFTFFTHKSICTNNRQLHL